MASPDALRPVKLFGQFDEATLARIADRFTEVDFPANQVVIEPRTVGAGLYVICDGTVEVEAHEIRRELGAGEIVGEISLIEEDHSRRARVTTKTPVRGLALSRADFDQLVEDEPGLGDAVRALAAERLTELR